MMRPPPWPRMTRAAACEHRNTPVRLTRTTRSHSSSVIASVALTTFTPALLIRTSSRPPPKRAACAIPVSTLMAEPTSRPIAQAWPPVAAMASATDLAEASWTSATIARAPAFAKASAVARPIPRPAPVTRHVRPVTSKRSLMRAAAMIGLVIRGDTGPPVKIATPEYLATDRRRTKILERAIWRCRDEQHGGASRRHDDHLRLHVLRPFRSWRTSARAGSPGVAGQADRRALRRGPHRGRAVVLRRDQGREAPGVSSADLGHAREHPGHRGEEPARDQRHRPRLGRCRRPGDGADADRQSDSSCHGAGAAGQGPPADGSRRTPASQASVRGNHAFPGLARFTAHGGAERHRQDRRWKLGRRAGSGRTDRAGRSLGPQQWGLIAQSRVVDRRIRDAG